MKVKIIKKSELLYRADLLDLPGMPPVGEGHSPEQALLNLFYLVLKPNQGRKWSDYIDWNNCELIES